MSSGWYKYDWSYRKYKEIKEAMLKGEDGFVCSIPFTCSLEHGLLTKKKIKREMEKESMSHASFLMEYCGVFWGESDDAFFQSSWLNPCRILESVYYLPDKVEWLQNKDKKRKDKPWYIPKVKGEIRIVSCDIALSKGNRSDNSIYSLIRLIPEDGVKYRRLVVNMEAYNGMEAEKQAVRIKQIFYDFEADYIIIDSNGIGNTVWSYIQKVNYDSERDIWYDAFTCFNNDDTVDKKMAKNATPVVYSMKATPKTNSDMALSLRDNFINGSIELLIDHIEAKQLIYEKELIKPSANLEQMGELEAKYLAPYIQISVAINEMINLEYSTDGGAIKIDKKSGTKKDRYSSLAYANFLADILEKEFFKGNKDDDQFLFLT